MSSPKSRSAAGAPGGFLALIAVVVALNVIGLVMVLSASSVHALRESGNSWSIFAKQVMWVMLGTAALIVMARFDHRHLRRLAPLLVAIAGALLLVVLIPGIGISVNGSTRWLGSGPFRVQPSEFAKLAVIVFSAELLARRANHMHDFKQTLMPVIYVVGALAALVMLQPDMGTTLVIGGIVIGILFAAGVPAGAMFKLTLIGGALAFVAGMIEPYRRARLTAFLDPFADAGNTGYQVVQSLVGLGSGGLGGIGLGESRAKWGFLPNAHTDFIYTIIGEELGMIGALVVLSMFAAFVVLGIRTAMRAPDRFGMLLAVGVTGWVTVQAVINIGASVGILPVTGVPLPFISFGGSSLVVTMAATGILLNVARAGVAPRSAHRVAA